MIQKVAMNLLMQFYFTIVYHPRIYTLKPFHFLLTGFEIHLLRF